MTHEKVVFTKKDAMRMLRSHMKRFDESSDFHDNTIGIFVDSFLDSICPQCAEDIRKAFSIPLCGKIVEGKPCQCYMFDIVEKAFPGVFV